ncbi:MAG: phosphoglycerate kinase [Actinobacteria bacterium]|nr:MAG: phosphoglycerate kinase [Actinomycetota bacterium]
MFAKKTVKDIDVDGKRVLVRVDFNVPLEDGRVADDTRIRFTLPTIRHLLDRNAKVILMSHLGRPKAAPDPALSLEPVSAKLSEFLGRPVKQLHHTVDPCVTEAVDAMRPGDVIMLENLRFNAGEKENDDEFSKSLAALADIYVNDAFGVSHRKHASVVGVAQHLPAVAGTLLQKEVETLSNLLDRPLRPFVAVLGGSKVSDKIAVVNRLLDIVDALLVGGGMCFTFLKAQGLGVGKSIVEDDQIENAERMLAKAEVKDIPLYLPKDLRVAAECVEGPPVSVVGADDIPAGEMGLDIGPVTAEIYSEVIVRSETVFWNGPMGVFELQPFEAGTRDIATAVARSGATSIVGGGDTDAALRKFGLEGEVSFISTGGGASMKMLEGAQLPGVAALSDK